MNRKQKGVLLVGIAVMAGMMLFPPWYGRKKDYYRSMGYHLVFTPPYDKATTTKGGAYFRPKMVRIDKDRLAIQCLIAALITGGLMAVLHEKGGAK